MRRNIVLAFVALSGALEAQLFAPPQIYPATHVATPRALVADFNGDGFPDVAIDATDATTSAIDVYPGDGAGGLLAPIRSAYVNPIFAPNHEPTYLIGTADLNQDGKADLVTSAVCTWQPGLLRALRFHLSLGTGQFTQVPFHPTMVGSGMSATAVADLDGNGIPEIVVRDYTNTLVYSVFGSPPVPVLAAILPGVSGIVAIGDFNGDGQKDVAVGNTSNYLDEVTVFVQGPPMAFTPVGPFGTGESFAILTCDPLTNHWMVAHDIDADGDDDLVLQNPSNFARVLPGHPVTVLGAVVGPPLTGNSLSGDVEPVVDDFDSDGIADIVEGYIQRRLPPSFQSGLLSIPNFTGAGQPWIVPAVAAADMDGDGDRDLIYAGYGTVAIARGETIRSPACAGFATTPQFRVGSPFLGNPAFTVELAGIQPGAAAILGVSSAPGLASAGPCLVAIGLAPNELILPAGSLGITSANASGVASVTVAIPNAPALDGVGCYAQWIAASPAGPITLAGTTWLLSGSKKIVIW